METGKNKNKNKNRNNSNSTKITKRQVKKIIIFKIKIFN